jgi:hypothetical protein
MLSLKDNCVHSEIKEPYIVSISGGKDNSPEGMQVWHPYLFYTTLPWLPVLQKGLTHGFVVEFASIADRDYYVAKDPTHAKVGAVLFENSEEITVLDYEAGIF